MIKTIECFKSKHHIVTVCGVITISSNWTTSEKIQKGKIILDAEDIKTFLLALKTTERKRKHCLHIFFLNFNKTFYK